MTITQRDIEKLKVGIHRIETGFYVRIRPGTGSYLVRASINGHRKDYVIGSINSMSLTVAKARACELRTKLSLKTEIKDNKQQNQNMCFDELAKIAIDATEKARQWRNAKHAAQWRTTVATYASPKIGKKLVSQIDMSDILSVVQPIWLTKTETASRLLGRLERIIDYAIFIGVYNKANPARWKNNLDMVLPLPGRVKPHRHHEAPNQDEIKLIAQQLKDSPFISHKVTLFGILTACRANEFCQAQWKEIDLKAGVFSVPPERRKDGKPVPHRVALSTQAIELLRSIEHDSEYVFTGRSGSVNLETPRLTLKRLLKRSVTMHGCRSTFRDWCAETGKDPIVAEKCLMHTTGNEVVQAYQRSDLLEQRRILMQEWADYIFSSK